MIRPRIYTSAKKKNWGKMKFRALIATGAGVSEIIVPGKNILKYPEKFEVIYTPEPKKPSKKPKNTKKKTLRKKVKK